MREHGDFDFVPESETEAGRESPKATTDFEHGKHINTEAERSGRMAEIAQEIVNLSIPRNELAGQVFKAMLENNGEIPPELEPVKKAAMELEKRILDLEEEKRRVAGRLD